MGKPFTVSGPGMLARVIQHENDHLNGVLFIDHMKLAGKMIQMNGIAISLQEYVDNWIKYLEAQYEFMTPLGSGKPRYGTNEDEKQKLMGLEALILDKVA